MSIIWNKIAPTDLRDYAKSLGWLLQPDAVDRDLYVLSHPELPRRQLVFPINTDAPDYAEAVENTVDKLSNILHQPVQVIISGLSELKDDTLRFRIVDTRNEDGFLPLSYAVSAINGAKELYLSAASTVLKPQSHHPRLSRREAWQLLEASRFRHTETGSFVLKVSSPVQALEIQGSLFEQSIPFARQATLTINQGLNQLVNAIQSDTLTELVDEIKADTKPEISSNLCNAIMGFKEEHNDFDLFVDFTWAGAFPVPVNIPVKKLIKIQKDYFARIDDVRRDLRSTEQQRNKEEVFMATVEHLAGDMGDDGQRSGEVILNLYQAEEDDVVRARLSLDATQYLKADEAHMTAGAFIRVKGRLQPGNQPRNLTEVSLFELILP